ncbi:hypothetical protein FITA111629_14100 [Filibacter tadaridae]|uniref:Phenylalanyl-tRNA synthetase subunit beta n=1 Tax=Filibacter tadaridae TaxID=2483811 RepID=A0A3P5X8M6_9BACL|nr:hypothetical protein [Filibacter tadaridae]VDC27579.1 hypothetical protein FILTAD_01669 [Filibacter tadaridae]
MKFLRRLIITVIVLAVLGLGVYYIGTKMIADQLMGQVSEELDQSGQLESIKDEVRDDPQLQAFIAEGKNVDSEKLPFQTKEQATRLLLKKFNMSELAELQAKARSGMTAEEKQQLFDKIENRLTEEEMLALKVLAYKELMK